MNERNVAALVAELEEAGRRGHIPWEPGWSLVNAARYLAARGVLVPACLTDEEIMAIRNSEGCAQWVRDEFRAELERIAKGESP